MTVKVCLVVFWAVCMALWGMSVWGRWADSMYERQPVGSPIWYWLRVSGAPHTRQNCVRFIKRTSIAGMVCVTLAVGATLIWGS